MRDWRLASGKSQREQPWLTSRMVARTVIERDRRPVARERDAARDARRGGLVRLDETHAAQIRAGVRVEDTKLIAIHQKRDAPAVRRPRDLVGFFGLTVQRLHHARVRCGADL